MNLISSGEVKTRKEHKCHGCCDTIPTGTKVYSQTIADEGTVYTIYMCKQCRDYCSKCNDCPYVDDADRGYVRECRNTNDWGSRHDE